MARQSNARSTAPSSSVLHNNAGAFRRRDSVRMLSKTLTQHEASSQAQPRQMRGGATSVHYFASAVPSRGRGGWVGVIARENIHVLSGNPEIDQQPLSGLGQSYRQRVSKRLGRRRDWRPHGLEEVVGVGLEAAPYTYSDMVAVRLPEGVGG